jgi:hypothetical protein
MGTERETSEKKGGDIMKNMGRSAVVRFVCAVALLSLVPTYSTGAMMEEVRMGMLSSFKGHHASGKVSIVKHEKGNLVLTLTDIKVDKVPDGRVYLAKGGDYTKGIEIGLLKKFTGTVEFPIPAGTNLDEYDSVVIWCKKFNVGIGRAYFEKEMMKEKGTMKY